MSTPPRRTPSAIVALVVGIFAFVTTVAWFHDDEGGDRAGRRAAIAAIVQRRQLQTASYEQRLADLRARVASISAGSGEQLRRLRAAADEAAAMSGGTAVTGPGLLVVLSDAAGAKRDSLDSDSRILDVDLQAVVNELWAAGAEAIAVNGQRIIATTAIRNAGAAVLVNYRILQSPYRVEAIGHPDVLRARFEASEIAGHFRDWSSIYGLGFDVGAEDGLEVPAYRSTIRFRYARPIEEG